MTPCTPPHCRRETAPPTRGSLRSPTVGRTLPGAHMGLSGAAADAILAAGWRPPARTLTTVDELDALPSGAVLTDRYGLIWIRGEQEWCEPRSTEVEVAELIEWAPLTVHLAAADGPASEDLRWSDLGSGQEELSVPRAELQAGRSDRQGSAAMNTSTHTVIDTTVIGSPVTAPAPAGADEVPVSMAEVDAAAARAALTEHLRLPAADLEHPSVVAEIGRAHV